MLFPSFFTRFSVFPPIFYFCSILFRFFFVFFIFFFFFFFVWFRSFSVSADRDRATVVTTAARDASRYTLRGCLRADRCRPDSSDNGRDILKNWGQRCEQRQRNASSSSVFLLPLFSTAAPPRALAPLKKQEKMQQNRTTKKESQRETTYTGSPLTRSIYPILNYERIFENARHLFPSRRRASIRPSLRWMNFMMKYRSGDSVSLFQGWLEIRSGSEYSHKCLIRYFSLDLNFFTFSTMHFIWFYRSIRAK